MRPIEFRAWHKQERKMYEVIALHLGVQHGMARGDCVNYVGLYGKSKLYIEGEEVELLEYTGLKDCKGEKIYEGDIVKVDSGLDELKVSVIEYKQGCFITKGIHSRKYSSLSTWVAFSDTMEYIEIIGNIYENKELLSNGES